MTEPNALPQRFIVTTPGLSATRWLSFALSSNPDVFVAHGKHPLDSVIRGDFSREKKNSDVESLTLGNKMNSFYQKLSLDEVFSVYYSLKPGARAYGNVHTYTLETLMDTTGSADALVGINVLNVLRHPVTYIASHISLVRTAENYPEVYRHYTDEMFPQALEEYPELFLLECEDYRAFLAFTVSCLSVRNLAHDFVYPQFRHVQMEVLTTQVEALQSFCASLTGLAYSTRLLEAFIQQGAINRHQKAASGNRARDIHAGWATWQQDIAQMMIPTSVLDKLEEVGYDVSMLCGDDATRPAQRDDASSQTECLADYLRRADERHPLLALLHRADEPETLLLDTGYHGFNLVRHQGRYYALAQSLGPVDLNQLDEPALDEYQAQGQCLVAASFDELKRQVDQPVPMLVEAGFHGFNLVQYRRQCYGLALTLGPVDLSRLDEPTLHGYQMTGQCFVGRSLEEVKRQIDDPLHRALQQELARQTDERDALQQELARRADEREALWHELSRLKSTRWFKVMNRIDRLR